MNVRFYVPQRGALVLMGVREFAEGNCMSRHTVYRRVRHRQLPSIHVGGRVFIPLEPENLNPLPITR